MAKPLCGTTSTDSRAPTAGLLVEVNDPVCRSAPSPQVAVMVCTMVGRLMPRVTRSTVATADRVPPVSCLIATQNGAANIAQSP